MQKTHARRKAPVAKLAPHSWDLEHWPADVYPHSESRARYLVRAYREELILAGALTRIGRELVVFGEGYCRWLARGAVQVPDFQVPANRKQTGATTTS